MRKYTVYILILVLLPSAGSLNAEQPGEKISLNLSFGFAQPAKPKFFTDMWRTGVSFGFGVSYNFSQQLSAELDLNYHLFGIHEERYLRMTDEFGIFSSMSGGSRYILAAGGNLKWFHTGLSDYYHPYIFGGIGMLHNRTTSIYKIGTDMEEYSDEISRYSFSIPLGLGITLYPLEAISFSLEGRYLFTLFQNDHLHVFVSRLLINVKF